MSLLPAAVRGEAFAEASRFRGKFYECLTARRDELFELVDAVLCADGAVHPRLTHRSSWLDHDGELPLVEGTLMRLKVEHLSKDRDTPPVWSWSSKTGATPDDVDRFWQAFLRRFDLEHTFRFAKQTLGWTTPKLRTPEAADRWTWILIVAHTQLAGHPATTSARPSNAPRPSRPSASPEDLGR